MNTNINKNIKNHEPLYLIIGLFVYLIIGLFVYLIIGLFPAFAAEPSSTNYSLQEYSFGNGGTSNSTSSNYKLNAIAGEIEFGKPTSTNFGAGSGLTYLQMSNLPPAPTVTNPSHYYNKLKVVINTGNNPTDTTFAISALSSSGSATLQYAQADGTLSNNPVWQTYTNWGGASGFTLIGLTTNATYTIAVAAKQGNFTQTGFGPSSTAATITPTLSYSISSNSISIGQLTPGSVITANPVTVTLTSNGTSGAVVYLYDNHTGLLSATTSYTISAVSNNLASIQEGYGAQGTSTSQSSGGPMEILSPYNGSANTVGIIDSTKRPIFDSSSQPVTTGTASFALQAKASNVTQAANDYSDTLTVITAATF